MRLLGGVVVLLLVAASAVSTGSDDPIMHRVLVGNYEFTDDATGAPLTIANVGDVVEFVLENGMHTATGGALGVPVEGHGPRSPILTEPGETYLFPVTGPGPIAYTCIIHPEMEAFILAS